MKTTLEKFKEAEKECDDLVTETPLERLRFFVSLMHKDDQDWIDIEQFFDAVEAQINESKS